jgi:hypothetical protein
MPRQVSVVREDIPLIQEIFDALVCALENLPERLMGNGKFGVLAMTAIFNIACRVALKAGVQRDEFMASIGKIWDDRVAAAAAEGQMAWN